ncbi:MAG: SDR family oxidoreductase, partial [Sinobacteraceae bacterium]|nr:SDR family oxidoreductase [Nevskiaceae bacterium]
MSPAEKAIERALSECHALVTGASRGIGWSIASALSEQGVRVSLLGRDGQALAQAAAQLGGASHALALVADVTDSAAVARAFTQARGHFGAIDILVNNAGQAASARFTDTDEQLWNRVMSVNVHGTYLCTRQAVPDMLHR